MTKLKEKITIELTEQDVKKNLQKIIEEMQQIREESTVNLRTTDEQKMDYLRLTGELASCVNALTEDRLTTHVDNVISRIQDKPLLKNYDPLQQKFWNEEALFFKSCLDSATIAVLGDNYNNTTQSYHLFQAIKYLHLKENRDEVFETIQPVNTLLNKEPINSTEIMKKLFDKIVNKVCAGGIGVRLQKVKMEELYELFDEVGAMYIELSKEFQGTLKDAQTGKFKEELVTDENDVNNSFVRIIRIQEQQKAINAFEQLKRFAEVYLGVKEESLVRKPSNFYVFGKEFLKEMLEKMTNKKGTNREYEIIIDEELTIDDPDKVDPDSKIIPFWKEKLEEANKELASMGELYRYFKELKRKVETGTDKEKAEGLKKLLTIINLASSERALSLPTSTVLKHKGSSYETRITHHAESQLESLIKETTLDVGNLKNDFLIFTESVINIKTRKAEGLLQALFDTEDDNEKITKILEFITGDKNDTNIKIFTKDSADRRDNTTCETYIHLYNRRMDIRCDSPCYSVVSDKALAITPKKKEREETSELPALTFEVESGVDKNSQAAHFSNTQEIGDWKKYSALVCFNDTRYVISMIGDFYKDTDTKVSEILSKQEESTVKLEKVCEEFGPSYAHLVKFEIDGEEYKQVDDMEYFGK